MTEGSFAQADLAAPWALGNARFPGEFHRKRPLPGSLESLGDSGEPSAPFHENIK